MFLWLIALWPHSNWSEAEYLFLKGWEAKHKEILHQYPDLDWGTVLSTNRKMAFSEGSWMRFLMIHINWATVMSEGTKYFLLSMSTICDPDTFSTITWQTTWRHQRYDYNQHATSIMKHRSLQSFPLTGTLSGYLLRILADSIHRCSVGEKNSTLVLNTTQEALIQYLLSCTDSRNNRWWTRINIWRLQGDSQAVLVRLKCTTTGWTTTPVNLITQRGDSI